MPKLSIVTVSYNAQATIASTLASVRAQDWPDYEHLLMDGGSKDATLEIADSLAHPRLTVVSGPDRGIYDAMNKGLAAATGDFVAFLNADDFYCRTDALSLVARAAMAGHPDAVSAGVAIVDARQPDRIVRRYPSTTFRPWMVRVGHMPPHPGFFASRRAIETVGPFDIGLRTAADFDWMARFFAVHGLRATALPETVTFMRAGGQSQRLDGIALARRESAAALKRHGRDIPLVSVWPKYLIKAAGLLPTSARAEPPEAVRWSPQADA